jgi:hypothetical protein
MNTLRTTTIYPVTITLDEIDQYNDYSVIFDYKLSVDDPETGYFRQWHCGTNRQLALDCYFAVLNWVSKEKACGNL